MKVYSNIEELDFTTNFEKVVTKKITDIFKKIDEPLFEECVIEDWSINEWLWGRCSTNVFVELIFNDTKQNYMGQYVLSAFNLSYKTLEILESKQPPRIFRNTLKSIILEAIEEDLERELIEV